MIPTVEVISKEICAFIRSSVLVEGLAFDENSCMGEIGIDSLSIIEILLFIERRFNIIIPEGDITRENLKSVTALSVCVYLKASGG